MPCVQLLATIFNRYATMKKYTVLLAFLLLAGMFCTPVSAQNQARSQAIYGELLGPSQGIGFSYDARIKKGARDGFGLRAGLAFGYAASSNFVAIRILDDNVETWNQMFRFAAPLEINYLVGKKASKFEMGLGTVVCADRYTSDNGAKPKMSCGLIPYLSLGYRLVTEKGFLLRAGALPIFDFSDKQFSLYPYLSFGWAF